MRFVPCSIGADHCRLRHIGWEKCGHGLTSRPRESASVPFLNELLGLFRYPAGSGHALLAGTLPLRYSAARFVCSTPLGGYQFLAMLLIWLLLILIRLLLLKMVRMFTGWFWFREEKNSTEQKNSCTPRWVYGSLSSTGVEEVESCGFFQCFRF